MKIRDLTVIPALISILVVADLALSMIPVVQIIVLLIMVCSRVFKTMKTMIIVLGYVYFDCLLSSGLHIGIFLPMLCGWICIPIIMRFIKTKNAWKLGGWAILFSLLYSWMYIPFNMIFFGIDWKSYLIADIPFEIGLAISSFITVIWVFQPLVQLLKQIGYGLETNQKDEILK